MTVVLKLRDAGAESPCKWCSRAEIYKGTQRDQLIEEIIRNQVEMNFLHAEDDPRKNRRDAKSDDASQNLPEDAAASETTDAPTNEST